ncbi:hypothetical protein [Nitrosomonas sp. wSCUT-2]
MNKFLSLVFMVWCCCITAVSATEVYYDRLLDQDHFSHLNRSTVKRMQQNLAVIYRYDRDWARDVALSQHPLTDGTLGPVTLFWLQRFIYDFKIEPVGRRYVDETILRLERIASFAGMFPEELKILISSDFSEWNDDQPDKQKSQYFGVRRSGSDQALLDLVYLYLQVVEPPPDPGKPSKNQLVTFYYQLSAEDFKVLQGKNQIQAQLAKLVNKRFDNAEALKEAVTGVLNEYPELAEKLAVVIERYFRYADPVISQSFLEILMGDSLFASLNSILVKLLENTISGIAYPDQHLFAQAVKSKVSAGVGACQNLDQQNEYISRLKLSDDDFDKLTEDLLTGPYQGIPDFSQQLKQIDLLRMRRKDDCEAEDLALINEFVSGVYENVIHPAIQLHYKKKPDYRATNPIRWDGSGCGCVLDDLTGTVYGLYPFWRADGAAQSVNFSVLSRVAYYGLSFDEDGIIKQTNNPHNDVTVLSVNDAGQNLQAAFIRTARKHNSKVDWVVHNDKPYWDRWKAMTVAARVMVLETLTDSIVNLLTAQLTDSASKFAQNLTLGVIKPATRGDGVTLYFNDFPDDYESVGLFNRFFSDLQKRLQVEGNDYFVNILVSQSRLGSGIYRYSNLLAWIDQTKPATGIASAANISSQETLNTKILVFIEEPTTDSKKKLRLEIENSELHGMERGLLLRNIIPVIEFDGKNWKQLEDDVVYFKDNFGGIGFWPFLTNEAEVTAEMPFRCDEIQSVSGCLTRFFQATTWHGEPESMLEKVVCDNRYLFRIAFGLLVSICLIYTGLYFYSCRVRSKIRNWYVFYLILIVVPTLIVAILLLTYDPMLEPVSEGNLPLIMLLFGGVAASIVVYQRRKKQMRKPTRPRGLAYGNQTEN